MENNMGRSLLSGNDRTDKVSFHVFLTKFHMITHHSLIFDCKRRNSHSICQEFQRGGIY